MFHDTNKPNFMSSFFFLFSTISNKSIFFFSNKSIILQKVFLVYLPTNSRFIYTSLLIYLFLILRIIYPHFDSVLVEQSKSFLMNRYNQRNQQPSFIADHFQSLDQVSNFLLLHFLICLFIVVEAK